MAHHCRVVRVLQRLRRRPCPTMKPVRGRALLPCPTPCGPARGIHRDGLHPISFNMATGRLTGLAPYVMRGIQQGFGLDADEIADIASHHARIAAREGRPHSCGRGTCWAGPRSTRNCHRLPCRNMQARSSGSQAPPLLHAVAGFGASQGFGLRARSLQVRGVFAFAHVMGQQLGFRAAGCSHGCGNNAEHRGPHM